MPGRKIPLITDHYYHIYNRGIDFRPIFSDKRGYQRFIKLLEYYRFANFPFSFSKLKRLSQEDRGKLLQSLDKKNHTLIGIVCFCLMPNHFHLLVKQTQDDGVSWFVSQLQNSYTKYFNKKHERVGPIFQSTFKSVLVENEQQLLHLSRYIHLNPYSAAMVKGFDQLISYPWSSLAVYLEKEKSQYQFCQTKTITSYFQGLKNYKKFLLDRADYQKELEQIKHLTLE
ncbi:transposase [Candidatus Shapirobacteria bacterium]|nr:transposase [Candidatus Shapirobacteria bacterium]